MPPRPRSETMENQADPEMVDIDEVSPHDNDRRRKRSKKKRKVAALFNESGLTDAERRGLRMQQRIIATNLRENCKEMEEIEDQRSKNNTLFYDKVCYTREAVLDADNLDLIVGKYSQHIEKNFQVPRYDAGKLANKLASKCSLKKGCSRIFDWRALGQASGVCFNSIPENVSFFAGSLDSQAEIKRKQARKPRHKEVIDESKEEEPEAVKNSKADADQLSAAEKNLKQMKQILKSRAREQVGKSNSISNDAAIDGVKFLFNPKSFTQTVENIFNFSFLIKKGDAEIGVRDGMGLYVKPQARPSDDAQHEVTTTQAVISFNMRDWRRIVEQHGLAEGDLPHRTGSKHARVG